MIMPIIITTMLSAAPQIAVITLAQVVAAVAVGGAGALLLP